MSRVFSWWGTRHYHHHHHHYHYHYLVGLGGGAVHNPGVNEALTHEVIHCGVEIKAVLVSGDAAALVLSKIIMNIPGKNNSLSALHNSKHNNYLHLNNT